MNFNEKLIAYIQLIRPVNVLITFLSIPVACWITGSKNWAIFLLSAITGALVAAGANAINDVFDIDIDKINKPTRPLPRGVLSINNARKLWLFSSAMAFGINLYLNIYALLIVVFAVGTLYYYSKKLKRTVLIGNITVSLMTAMAFVYGGALSKNISTAIIPAVFAFLVNFARELVKDAEDVEGDRMYGAETLAVKYGVRLTIRLSEIILFLLIALTILVAIASVYNVWFLYIVLVADVLLIVTVIILGRAYEASNSLKLASKMLKVSMVVGLLSIIFGSI